MHKSTADRYLHESIEDLKLAIVLIENSGSRLKTQSLKSICRKLQAVQDGIANGLSELEMFEEDYDLSCCY